MRKIALLFLVFVSNLAFGRQAVKDLLKEKKDICQEIIVNSTGKSETFDKLIKVGNEGLALTKSNDYSYSYFFNQSIGIGYYYKQDFKQARKHFEQAYDAATRGKMIQLSLKPLGNLTAVYYYLGLSGKADTAAIKLKQLVETTDTLKNKYDSYYYLGIYNQQQKAYYGIALDNFIKSAEYHKKVVDTTSVMKIKLDYAIKLMMIAEIYIYLKQPDKALEYLGYAGPYLDKSIMVDVSAYGKYVRAYVLKGNEKQARKYYDLLHNVVGKTPGRWSELVSSNLEMAGLALKQRQFPSAKKYVDLAHKQASLDNAEMLTAPVNVTYGDYYKETGDYARALQYYAAAEAGSRTFNREQYADLLKQEAALSIRLGRVEAAKKYFDEYVVVSDSLSKEKISLNLAEMEARFQNRLKQTEIGFLNFENKSKQEQLVEEKKTRWYLAGAAILALLVAAMIYRNFIIKKRANALLDDKNRELNALNLKLNEANQAKARLFGIISHDLRSPISRLFSFLKIQQTKPELLPEQDRLIHQQTLVESSSQLLNSLEDLLLWSKSQMESFEMDEEELDLRTILDELFHFLQEAALKKNLVLVSDDQQWHTLVSDRNMLQTMLRNILENAIRNASANGKIEVNLGMLTKGERFISVRNESDNLTGIDVDALSNSSPNSRGRGYGLVIIRELAEKIGASVLINVYDNKYFELKLIFNK